MGYNIVVFECIIMSKDKVCLKIISAYIMGNFIDVPAGRGSSVVEVSPF